MLEIEVNSNHNPANALHTLDYDANGNRIDQLIQSNGVDRGIFYSYDTENRLTQHQNYLVTGGGDNNGSGDGPCNAGNGLGNGNGCNNNGNGQDNNNENGNGNQTGQPDPGSGGGVGNPTGNGTLNSVLLKAHTDLEYDGVGRRLISTYYPGASDGGKRTEFAFDRRDPIVEYSVWNQHATNLYRDDQQNLLFKHALTAGNNVTSGNRFFFHHDGQGNVSAVTKHQGQADKSYRYEAYGNILHPSSNAAVQRNGYSLSQKRFNDETELYYFGARHYDASTGTWLTQDIYRGESRNPQSLHRYMYNYNSPINYLDWYGYFGQNNTLDYIGGYSYQLGNNLLLDLPYQIAINIGSTNPDDVDSYYFQLGRQGGNSTSLAISAWEVKQGIKFSTAGYAQALVGGGLCLTGTGCVAGGPIAARGGLSVAAGALLNTHSAYMFSCSVRNQKIVGDLSKSNLVDEKGKIHILEGDGPWSGGHRYGTGKSGKSEFPKSWSDRKILDVISDIATDPSLTWSKPDYRGYISTSKTVNGIDVLVVVDAKKGRIVTGYPTNTPKNQ